MTGRIVKALSGFYYVETDGGTVTCRARGKFRKAGVSPLVGDLVELTQTAANEGVVDRILPRRNAFDRPAVANIDTFVIVICNAIPQTDTFLVDRITALASLKGCEVLICINKCDLDPATALREYYRRSGFRTLCVSAATGEGIEHLRAEISEGVSAFTGNSGVGKSSILNALDPRFSLSVGEVSTALGRGRHTTRHVELFSLSCGAEIMDTPGFSSFDTDAAALSLREHLGESFPDFAPYLSDCRFVGCSHTKEKGCRILQAVKDGDIVKGRHDSYCRLFQELKEYREWEHKDK